MGLRNALPSKKFVITFSIAILVGLAILFVLKNSKQTTIVTNESSLNQLRVTDIQNLDSDGDGLKDWEENLWGTNPLLKDSDGNGVEDGVQIENTKISINPYQDGPSDEDLNETELFARQLFTLASNISSTNGEIGVQVSQELNNSIRQIVENPVTENQYTEFDIVVLEQTFENYRNYSSQATSILFDGIENGILSETELFADLNELNDTGVLIELQNITVAYIETIDALVKLPTTTFMKDNHLRVINDLNSTLLSLINFSQLEENPIIAASGFVQFKERVTELEITLELFIDYMNSLDAEYGIE